MSCFTCILNITVLPARAKPDSGIVPSLDTMASTVTAFEASPVIVSEERNVAGETYIASNDPALVSLDFVADVYRSENTYWAKEMSTTTISLMIQHSSILGIYHQTQQDGQAPYNGSPHLRQLQQVGMARFITDHVTHAYLTDIYVAPSHRGKGLGAWLVDCCNKVMEQMPFLRKAMLCTSDPVRNGQFYQKKLGMHVPVQDPETHLVLMRKGGGQVRHVPVRDNDDAE